MRSLRSAAFSAAWLLTLLPAIAAAQRADNPHGALAVECAACHKPDGWKPVKITPAFKHAEKTFPLDGAHQRTACTTCHKSLDFKNVPAGCAACHSDVHHAELGTDCSRCHTTRSFIDLERMRRVHEMTRFPLRGAHATAQCTSCHTPAKPGQSQYSNLQTACSSCHLDNYRLSKAPDHQAAAFSLDCASCHGVSTWVGGKFDHSTTKFALQGAHRTVTCSSCHADRVYVGKSTDCVSCHMPDYNKSVTPPHLASAFPTACATCHTVNAWKGASFDHSTTKFPLTGGHRTAICTDCHADNVFKGKSTTCVSCHQANFTKTTNPPHVAAGFSTDCASCHNTTQWPGAVFNHATTRFPLVGAHATAPCASCHADGVYHGKPMTCLTCHQADLKTATTPPHTSFPVTCEQCHNTVAWLGAAFDHSTTLFPLTGAHRTVTCQSCHGDNVYKGKPTTCISCHQPNYTTALLPPHSSLGFSTACLDCHTTTAWQPASFDHSTTIFPLTGAHRAASCADCHADKVYKGKSTACASCHLASFTATKNPPHTGFPQTCESCHTTTAWTPATFNHATTRFPLTGVHATTACSACHGDGVYAAKTTVCSGCHLANYTATTNPAHSAAGFPTTCESCHNTATWLGATFNHDGSFFPIYSGTHKGRWSVCADCHTSPSNYAAFTCTTCHTKTATDPKHKSVSGYSWDSNRCYSCHPKGRAG